MGKKLIKIEINKPTEEMIKVAIYTTEAFGFPAHMALKYINSGMLGYKLKEDGDPELDKETNKPIPLKVGRTKYFEYKEKYSELPEMYKTLKEFAVSGYTKLIVGFQAELALLHKLSIENMMALKEPLERQQIIDSLITKIIPTQSAFSDILKTIIENDPKYMGEEEKKMLK